MRRQSSESPRNASFAKIKTLYGLFLLFSFSVRCCPYADQIAEVTNICGEFVSEEKRFHENYLEIGVKGDLILKNTQDVFIELEFINQGFYCEIHKGITSVRTHPLPVAHFQALSGFFNLGTFAFYTGTIGITPEVRVGSTKKFENRGMMLLTLGGYGTFGSDDSSNISGRTRNPDLTITASESWINLGTIALRAYRRQTALAEFHLTSPVSSAIHNDGVITLGDTHLYLHGGVTGRGCILVKDSAVLVLSNPHLVDRQQMIYLSSKRTEALVVLSFGNRRSRFDVMVEGLKPACKIRFVPKLKFVRAYQGLFYFRSPDETISGVLRLHRHERDITFDGHTVSAKRSRHSEYTKPRIRPMLCRFSTLEVVTKVYRRVLQLRSDEEFPASADQDSD